MNISFKSRHKNIYCNNCSGSGHYYHQCPKPVISTGIILSTTIDYIPKYLLICRKDSLGYIDFIRGKYPIYNKDYIQDLINEMSIKEKENIINYSFNKLWDNLWGNYTDMQYKIEKKNSSDKFNQIKRGINISNDVEYDLKSLVKNSTTKWQTPEWGWPKGRRNYKENDIDCAEREFQEETGIHKKNIYIIKNIKPYNEFFIGSNYKSYQHIYYLAVLKNEYISLDNFQKSEVSNIGWYSLEECINLIRPYNGERIKFLKNINKVFTEQQLHIL